MKSTRITVSIPNDLHIQIQTLAEKNSLSVAWVVRQAISEFVKTNDDPASFNPLEQKSSQVKR